MALLAWKITTNSINYIIHKAAYQQYLVDQAEATIKLSQGSIRCIFEVNGSKRCNQYSFPDENDQRTGSPRSFIGGKEESFLLVAKVLDLSASILLETATIIASH